MLSALGSVRRVALSLILIVALAAGTLALYDAFVQAPINLPTFADDLVRITLIVAFWFSVLAVIIRSKAAVARHLGEQPATVIQLFLASISLLIMTFAVLHVLGVSPSSLLTGAGIASITIGLIVSTFVGSLLSGIFVFASHKFRSGDNIVVNGVPGKIEHTSAMLIRVRTDLGVLSIPNSAIASGAVLITKVLSHGPTGYSRLPYGQGDRIVTTYMEGEGTVTEVTPLHTRVLLDSGKELTFLNASILSGSIAVAKLGGEKKQVPSSSAI